MTPWLLLPPLYRRVGNINASLVVGVDPGEKHGYSLIVRTSNELMRLNHMKTIRCRSIVDEKHQVTVQLPHDIGPGEHLLTVTVEDETNQESRDHLSSGSTSFDALLAASESSLDFWNNPLDDEVWNDA